VPPRPFYLVACSSQKSLPVVNEYRRLDYQMMYLQTKDGAEVDLVIGSVLALPWQKGVQEAGLQQ
jgi:hypothetical protein